jgi:acetyl-CoA synthetase
MSDVQAFYQARELLLRKREDYDAAYAEFRWPQLERFNWALDYFNDLARDNRCPALRIVSSGGKEECLSFAELNERSNRVANFLRRLGVQRGDRLLLMLGNVVPLWEVTLAAMKLGAVVSPATTLLTRDDLADRIERGGLSYVVADAAVAERFAGIAGVKARLIVGGTAEGWTPYTDAYSADAAFTPEGETKANDPFFLYFTSGTTAKPKMVLHTHQSYPVGHLTTMYWLGLREGDLHFNISSPGWAKHAWSSFFAPWNAGATIFVYDQPRFDARQVLDALVRYEVSTLCAPPTVWRMLILEDLKAYPIKLRELASAGEPLNPEVMERVQAAWGLTIRDGYGQTETTALIANPPGQRVKPGSMGRPLPGYRIALFDGQGYGAEEGEICVAIHPRPVGLMGGYFGSPEQTAAALGGEYYHTGDVARRDEDGYFWYVGRADDVFKSSDYRISPFELESALIEHEAVAEAAVVPSPDPIRLSVPKAYLVLKPGYAPTRETALSVFRFTRQRLAPYKRVRRIEFYDLPKTISGKIRRVELRGLEVERRARDARGENEFWEEDFPELK